MTFKLKLKKKYNSLIQDLWECDQHKKRAFQLTSGCSQFKTEHHSSEKEEKSLQSYLKEGRINKQLIRWDHG